LPAPCPGIAAAAWFRDPEQLTILLSLGLLFPVSVYIQLIQMAADSTEQPPPSAPPADGATAETTTEPPKKFPKGVVLGKDGKP
jgi:hypothetical protein